MITHTYDLSNGGSAFKRIMCSHCAADFTSRMLRIGAHVRVVKGGISAEPCAYCSDIESRRMNLRVVK
jgi:hypothetical protein